MLSSMVDNETLKAEVDFQVQMITMIVIMMILMSILIIIISTASGALVVGGVRDI